MDADIRAFGCADAVQFTITLEPGSAITDYTLRCDRAVWFDRDLDGSWIVWATGPDSDEGEPERLGSIVVRDATVADFIEQLSHLLATPDKFEHGPRFERKAGLGSPPGRGAPRQG